MDSIEAAPTPYDARTRTKTMWKKASSPRALWTISDKVWAIFRRWYRTWLLTWRLTLELAVVFFVEREVDDVRLRLVHQQAEIYSAVLNLKSSAVCSSEFWVGFWIQRWLFFSGELKMDLMQGGIKCTYLHFEMGFTLFLYGIIWSIKFWRGVVGCTIPTRTNVNNSFKIKLFSACRWYIGLTNLLWCFGREMHAYDVLISFATSLPQNKAFEIT